MSTNKDQITIIGCGNMGGAIAKGIAAREEGATIRVFLYDRDQNKAAELSSETGYPNIDMPRIAQDSGLLVLAVKPGDFGDLAASISPNLNGQAVLSVMAGVSIKDIVSRLGKDLAVVRAMPNVGAFVQDSVTCLACNDKARNDGFLDKARHVFSGLGNVFEVNEGDMDLVTAVSGSGPAYLFYLAGSMIDSAVKNGMDASMANELVSGTLRGASEMLKRSGRSPGELIEMVASRGGTTEAALSVFEDRGFNKMVDEAIRKAKERSLEISREGEICS